jgi:methyl-accepting chemotaxis protein
MSEHVDIQDSRGDYLRRTARINEEIKRIVAISAGINLTAVNAMLVAKRAGERSRGFGVVSGELRTFSRHLEENMGETTVLVSRLVLNVGRLLNETRSQRQIDRAGRMSARSGELLAAVLARKNEALARSREKIGVLGNGLVRQAEAAMRLCQTGNALARSAKIEAVYGGDMAGTLRQVSNEVEERMTELLERLKSLGAGVEAWQA